MPFLSLAACALVVALLASLPLAAHETITTSLTYSREVSRLLNRRCVSCHQENSPSGIPLTTYAEVRPWAKAIKEQVLSRAMPPWGAVKGFGEFDPDMGLTQEEVSLLANWVEGGAPEGDPALLPAAPAPVPERAPVASRTLTTRGTLVLQRPVRLIALKPLPEQPVTSARLLVHRPNGTTEPLLWLSNYDPRWRRTYRLRTPLDLEAGSRIVSPGVPLRLVVQPLRGSSPAPRTRRY